MADADPVKKKPSRRTGKPENLTNAGKGRPPGALNKTTALLKDAILIAATKAGGKGGMAGYLEEQAKENPGPFLSLLGKVLPLQVTGENGSPLVLQLIERKIVQADNRDR
jgi:hypothetical protein